MDYGAAAGAAAYNAFAEVVYDCKKMRGLLLIIMRHRDLSASLGIRMQTGYWRVATLRSMHEKSEHEGQRSGWSARLVISEI